MSVPRGPMRSELLTWADVDRLVDVLVPQLRDAGRFDALLMVTRGGLVPGGLLCEVLGISHVLTAAVEFASDFGFGDVEPGATCRDAPLSCSSRTIN